MLFPAAASLYGIPSASLFNRQSRRSFYQATLDAYWHIYNYMRICLYFLYLT